MSCAYVCALDFSSINKEAEFVIRPSITKETKRRMCVYIYIYIDKLVFGDISYVVCFGGVCAATLRWALKLACEGMTISEAGITAIWVQPALGARVLRLAPSCMNYANGLRLFRT